jgi:ATP-dependent RNA helicase DDX31/DBP7
MELHLVVPASAPSSSAAAPSRKALKQAAKRTQKKARHAPAIAAAAHATPAAQLPAESPRAPLPAPASAAASPASLAAPVPAPKKHKLVSSPNPPPQINAEAAAVGNVAGVAALRKPLNPAPAAAAAAPAAPAAAAAPVAIPAAAAPLAHSRKHPQHFPKPPVPLSVSKQVQSAPAEETAPGSSTHLFATESRFETLGLDARICAHLIKPLSEHGFAFSDPTLVQMRAIPEILAGRDVLVRSETGSGKTLAFVLPILHSLVAANQRLTRSDGLFALMLSPTRELCTQIFDVVVRASRPFPWIVSSAVVGGEKKKSEKARLRKGVNILVATPGRLADHLRTTESLRGSLGSLTVLVLDEADRLMDSGFEKQVEEILGALETLVHGKHVQTVLLSATMTGGVERLVGKALTNPVSIVVSAKPPPPQQQQQQQQQQQSQQQQTPPDEAAASQIFTTPKQLVQHYLVVESPDRLVLMAAFIRRHVRRTGNTCKMLVFVASRVCAEFVHSILSQARWPAEDEEPGLGTKWWVLHGSVRQEERRRALREFARGRGGVLVCTDVAARGLDLPDVDLVVQMDAPSEVSEYVHRAGRTARSGRQGSAVLFLRECELEYCRVLEAHGLKATPVRTEPVYQSLLPREGGEGEALEAKALLQTRLERMVAEDAALGGLAAQAFASYVGAYAVHSRETKHVFVPRALHLGHVAKSFALKEPPTKAGSRAAKRGLDQQQHAAARHGPDAPAGGGKKRNRPMDVKSEFAAG